jgi:hypothetical protein
MSPKLKWLIVAAVPLWMASSGGGCSGAPSNPGVSENSSDVKTIKDCKLGNGSGSIKHVLFLIFDNVHLTRDNPNVPSDLEQMPHLKDFLSGNGALLSNHHTPLIAHTANDILTAFTGVYGDRHGVPIANSYRYFKSDGTSSVGVSFAYWTDPIFDPTTSTPADTMFNMLDQAGNNAPAPWVPYTRAGCNVGAVSSANIVLENIATDIPTVFGPDSGQAAEVVSNATQATADFVGIAIHCAKGDKLCSTKNGGLPDLLPDEPNGYSGYQGLFGHKSVAPVLSSTALTDLDGNVITDGHGNNGFPGFDGMSATISLGYVAAMFENGVQVVYAYISDAHDNHATATAYGPGEAGYVAALKSYDNAFDKFFKRLSAEGIDQSNTLFVVTSDENDHFVGGAPSPSDCDGINTACTYSAIGEVDVNLNGLLNDAGITTAFKVHSDSAPNVYITGNPADSAQTTRDFDRALAAIQVTNPITGNTEFLNNFLVDQTEMSLLHMITADPARDATVTMFAKPDYFVFAGGPTCTDASPCVQEEAAFAWNHGDVSPDINTTWIGMVGPGIKTLGTEDSIWSDHTDERPTMMALTGLADDYRHQGRVLLGVLEDSAKPKKLKANNDLAEALGEVYKQLNACVGQLSLDSLIISNAALSSGSDADDTTYTALENQLAEWTAERDTIALKIESILEGASFEGTAINTGDALEAMDQAQSLISEVHGAAELWTLTH